MINAFVRRIGSEIVVFIMTLVYIGVVAVGTVIAPVVLIGMWIHELVFRKERQIIDELVEELKRRREREGHCCEECRLKSRKYR